MNVNFPLYQFLGYKMLESHFYRKTDDTIKYFTIHVLNNEYHKDSSIYNIFIKLKLKFENCDESTFTFLSGYKINDEKWLNSLNDNSIKSLFFSVVFPFIREKINSICDDSRGGLIIPIIDLRGIDLSNEVIFTSNK